MPISPTFKRLVKFAPVWKCVLSIRDTHHNVVGWRFRCGGCPAERKFLNLYFHTLDGTYNAAVATMNSHVCPQYKEGKKS